jgi:nicotinamide mononucleotide transporter
MRILCSFILILLFNCSFATTYYINPKGNDETGNGSLGNPWKTLYIATAKAKNPGDIIHVTAGIYTEVIRSTLAPGVSIEGEGAASVIQSSLAETFVAIIIARSNEGTNGNQHISNITLNGSNRRTSWAIEIRGRSNFSVHDCIIKDFEESGVIWSGRNDNEPEPPATYATGNSFYNNTLTNCAKYTDYGTGCLAIGGQEGMLIYNNNIAQTGRKKGTNGWPIKYYNDGFLKGVKIYNNTITKQSFDGTSWDFAIELFNVSGLEIYNNTIIGSVDLNYQKKGTYPYSVYIHDNIIGPLAIQPKLENGIVLEYDTETAIIEKNQLRNLGVVIYFTPRTGSIISNVTIKDNFCDNIGVANKSHQGFAVRFGSVGKNNYVIENFFIYNNKFLASPVQKPYWGVAFLDAAKANNLQIKNNTIKGFTAAGITADPAYAIDTIIIENNILSGNGFANKPSYSFGVPQHEVYKNNTETGGLVFTLANIKMNIVRPFYYGLKNTSMLEFIAVFAGIISVWFSRKENIYVYPTGLINTIIYIFLSFDQGLLGEATVNFYYTIMSIYGWILWNKKDRKKHRIVRVTSSTKKEWLTHLAFFGSFFIVIFFALTYLKNNFYPGVIPWADAFASATAFTGMWLMTKKKVESWYWWIATNLASIPLYFVKHFMFTAVYYGILLVMAVFGLMEWKKRSLRKRKVAVNG